MLSRLNHIYLLNFSTLHHQALQNSLGQISWYCSL